MFLIFPLVLLVLQQEMDWIPNVQLPDQPLLYHRELLPAYLRISRRHICLPSKYHSLQAVAVISADSFRAIGHMLRMREVLK